MPARTEYPPGQYQDGMTCLNATMPTVSTLVTLVAPSQNITITNDGTTEILYVGLNDKVGPATTADFKVLPGKPLVYVGPPIESFYIIATANTATYSLLAY